MNPRFAIGACVAAILLALAPSVAAGSGATSPRERLLVLAAAPPAYREVAHVYDGHGRLLTTIDGPRRASLTWSPDGTLLAVGVSAGVWIEHADGNGRRRLLKTCRRACFSIPSVAWTPDGRSLAVGSVDPKATGFDLVNVANGHVTQLRAPRPSVQYLPIAFSPNGRLLAYTLESGDAGTASCCVTALVVVRADGSQPRILHRFGDPIHDGPGAATWSPDSSRIAFTDDGRDTSDPRLAVVAVASGKLHALDPRSVYDQSPAWSPDGTSLALTQYQGPAFSIAADGGSFHPLGVNGTLALWLHDGDLLLTRGALSHAVVVIPHGRGPARTLFTLPRHEQVLSLREAT